MTTSNKMLTYLSMVFFFSSINGMEQQKITGNSALQGDDSLKSLLNSSTGEEHTVPLLDLPARIGSLNGQRQINMWSNENYSPVSAHSDGEVEDNILFKINSSSEEASNGMLEESSSSTGTSNFYLQEENTDRFAYKQVESDDEEPITLQEERSQRKIRAVSSLAKLPTLQLVYQNDGGKKIFKPIDMSPTGVIRSESMDNLAALSPRGKRTGKYGIPLPRSKKNIRLTASSQDENMHEYETSQSATTLSYLSSSQSGNEDNRSQNNGDAVPYLVSDQQYEPILPSAPQISGPKGNIRPSHSMGRLPSLNQQILQSYEMMSSPVAPQNSGRIRPSHSMSKLPPLAVQKKPEENSQLIETYETTSFPIVLQNSGSGIRPSYSMGKLPPLIPSQNIGSLGGNPYPMYRPMTVNTKLVLAIDGGGSRGIIPLVFVKAFQDSLRRETGEDSLHISSVFDMFMGTSVGALVATTAVIDKIDYVDKNFQSIAENIFTKNGWFWRYFWGAWYSSKGKEKVFRELLKDVESEELKDMYTQLMIPVYSYNTNEPIMYDSKDPVITLFDALMGTSAASTYFEPHMCESEHGKVLQLIDPGMNKNSPALLAYRIMRSQYPADRIAVISLGTGSNSFVKKTTEYPQHFVKFGLQFPGIVMESAVQWDDWLMKKMAETDSHLLYERFQIDLDANDCLTDCIDKEHIISLKNEALKAIKSPTSVHYRHFQRTIKLIMDELARRGEY